MGIDTAGWTPAQLEVWRDLLAADLPRPAIEDGQAARWRDYLEQETAQAAALVPSSERSLFLSKSKLDALSCEGRYLDQLESPFAWNAAMVIGDLSHKAIEIDLAGRRERAADDVVRYAWASFSDAGHAAAEFLATLGGAEADDLRAQALRRMSEFRETFPPLASDILRAEVDMTVRLHDGAVLLRGRPDLLVGRAHAQERRQILIDLKTGNRQRHHRQDMRFYALLATVKYGVAPFRIATYYLDEAGWDYEDVDDDVLEAAARTVVSKVARAARLHYQRPAESELELLAGPACRWCGRNSYCSAYAELEKAQADGAA